MEDSVRPNSDECRAIYEEGFRTWFSLYERAVTSQSLPQPDFEKALERHPYFPRNLDLKFSCNRLFASGVSIWKTSLSPSGTCKIPSFEKKC